jgi:hypothetical protein
MRRVTARKRFIAKVRAIQRMAQKQQDIEDLGPWQEVITTLKGHENAYGVTDNLVGMLRFGQAVNRLLVMWFTP